MGAKLLVVLLIHIRKGERESETKQLCQKYSTGRIMVCHRLYIVKLSVVYIYVVRQQLVILYTYGTAMAIHRLGQASLCIVFIML